MLVIVATSLFSLLHRLMMLVLPLFPSTQMVHQPIQKYLLTGKAQGTSYRIIYYTSKDSIPAAAIDSLIGYMDDCFSLYKENSLVNQFNRSSHGVVVNEDFRKVMEQCIAVHQDTRGLADPTVYPLVRFWTASEKGRIDKDFRRQLKMARSCIGLGGVSIIMDSLVKEKPCLQLDLNGSAQGYTVDFLAQHLEQHQIKDYLVELGGEIRVKGRKQPAGEKFAIALEQPGDGLWPAAPEFKNYYLEGGAVTTSGNYRKFMESGGLSFGHIIDPRNGYPFHNEVISVTVFAETALMADAYDNAVLGMGLKEGMEFIEARPFLRAVFVFRDSSGKIRTLSSSRMAAYEKSS